MLITFSGVVGSGKSTAARYTLDVLETLGQTAIYIRFQSLTSLRRHRRAGGRRRTRTSSQWTMGASRTAMRGEGYRRRKLTLVRAVGYFARAILFRIFRLRFDRQSCVVLNRYFYDNLAHHRLTTRAERAYLSLLRLVIPVPDLPMVLVASKAVVAERRPNYAHAYLGEVRAGYENLQQYFPELILISSDGRLSMEENVGRVLRAALPVNHGNR